MLLRDDDNTSFLDLAKRAGYKLLEDDEEFLLGNNRI